MSPQGGVYIRALENEVISLTIPCGGWGIVIVSSVNPDQPSEDWDNLLSPSWQNMEG